MTKNKKPVASVDSGNGIIMGASDVIKHGDIVAVNGHNIDVTKAVKLGLKLESVKGLATKLNKDLKTGLYITFPIAILMDKLQRELGTGEDVLKKVGV